MSSQAQRPYRILFVATDLSTGGGVNKVIRDLAVLFYERLGADVTVANARSGRPPSYCFPDEISLLPGRSGGLIGYFRRLAGLRRPHPDFVIGPWTQDNLLIALAFLFSRTRVVLIEHASWDFHGLMLRLMRRLIYPLAWKVVVLNPSEQHYYERRLGNAVLIPNPVTPLPPAKDIPREKLVLAIGHLTPIKNFGDAIRTFAASGIEQDGWSLAIVGDGPEKKWLEQLIGELGLKRVTIHTSATDIGSWYTRATLSLVTSRTEVFSLVLAEAMLSGVVPLAYASDGPSFILDDFPDHLVPIGDVDRLAERLRRLSRENDLQPLREQLRTSIADRFAPELIAERWRTLFSGQARLASRRQTS